MFHPPTPNATPSVQLSSLFGLVELFDSGASGTQNGRQVIDNNEGDVPALYRDVLKIALCSADVVARWRELGSYWKFWNIFTGVSMCAGPLFVFIVVGILCGAFASFLFYCSSSWYFVLLLGLELDFIWNFMQHLVFTIIHTYLLFELR